MGRCGALIVVVIVGVLIIPASAIVAVVAVVGIALIIPFSPRLRGGTRQQSQDG